MGFLRSQVQGFLLALLSISHYSSKLSIAVASPAVRWPLFSSRFSSRPSPRSSYTPLIFFTLPPGISPECDAMEMHVKAIEKELNVRVERLDLLRIPASKAILEKLTEKQPPFLYHRESCQEIHVPKSSSAKTKTNDDDESIRKSSSLVKINHDRVRAWAKGRYLQPETKDNFGGGNAVPKPMVVSQEETALSQDELEDFYLTPQQLEGKRAIRDRTEERARGRMERSKE